MVTLGVASLEAAATPLGSGGPSVADLVCALVHGGVEGSYRIAISDFVPVFDPMRRAAPRVEVAAGWVFDARPSVGLHESSLPPPAGA